MVCSWVGGITSGPTMGPIGPKLLGCTVFREIEVITDTSELGQSVVSVRHCSMVDGVVLFAPFRGLGLDWALFDPFCLLLEAFLELRRLLLSLGSGSSQLEPE